MIKNILIGGDFNTVLNHLLDKRNGNGNYHSKIRKILNNTIHLFTHIMHTS